MKWYRKWKKQRNCFHHELPTYDSEIEQWRVAKTWIKSRLIETGKAKMFWCTGCDKTWI